MGGMAYPNWKAQMATPNAVIYLLSDPRTKAPFYVGRTIQPLDLRLAQHWQTANRKDLINAKADKIRELRAIGLKPLIDMIETVPFEEWQEAEKFWIEYFRFFGIKLTNGNAGGGGGTQSYVTNWTPELDAQLGVVADAIIAEQMGITRKAVTYRRKVLGIKASFDLSRMKPPPLMGGWNARRFTQDEIDQFGTAPDYVIAKKLGTNKATVAYVRRKLGIPSYAASTGNTGQYAKGNFPARWIGAARRHSRGQMGLDLD